MEKKLDISDQVFGNELVLDIIIDFAICKNDGVEDGWVDQEKKAAYWKSVRDLRLVHPNWTISVSKVLRKRKEPVFHIVLNTENSGDNSDLVKKKGKECDKFLEVMTTPSRIHFLVPPFELTICDKVYTLSNKKTLTSIFELFGEELIALKMLVPQCCSIHYPSVPLPPVLSRLRKVEMHFEREFIPPVLTGFDFTSGYENDNLNKFIQSVFNRSPFLSHFFVRKQVPISNLKWPATLPEIVLPPQLQVLEVECPVLGEELEGLILNRVPNLKVLGLWNFWVNLLVGGEERAKCLVRILKNLKSSVKLETDRITNYHLSQLKKDAKIW